MTNRIDAQALKAWLSDGGEIALLDVREPGQYCDAGHPFFAVSAPYSRFELRLPLLVPNPRTRVVLYDDGDGVAEHAAARAQEAGYANLHILEGGAPAWGRAGYTLYKGVNVPSKAFGELIEHERHTPRLTAEDLKALEESGADYVLVDGRPFAEYEKINVPGGICCPNGELALRIGEIAPDPSTRIVVNCAGRTRSIIGAQTLIDLGVPNPVHALENGTQGWFLAGFEPERGADRLYPETVGTAGMEARRAQARDFAEAHGAPFVTGEQVADWLGDEARTTYVFDVRTAEEYAQDGPAAAVHAPGGQLIQATDQWVGVRGARLVVLDSEAVRAPVVAGWLRQLGHEAYALQGGAAAIAGLPAPSPPAFDVPTLAAVTAEELAALSGRDVPRIIDLRPSMAYREGHIAGAAWSIRPRIAQAADPSRPVVLIADEPGVAGLAARDLREAGVEDARLLADGPEAWSAAGLEIAATPDEPADADCIDYPFFTHARNRGNAEHARAYLAWETGLVAQLDDQERGVFRIAPGG